MFFDFLLYLGTQLLKGIHSLQQAQILPDKWYDAFHLAMTYLYIGNYFFPVDTVIVCVIWYIGFEIALFLLRQAFSAINWIRGSGGFDI